MTLLPPFASVVAGAALVFPPHLQAAATNLLQNPNFTEAQENRTPRHWTPWSAEWSPARCRTRLVADGLLFEAPDTPHAVGGVKQRVPGVQGGQAYAVGATCELRNVSDPYQSVLVRVEWLHGGEPVHPAGMLARGPVLDGSRSVFTDVLVAPPEADAADVSLEVCWPRGGTVLWKEVRMCPTNAPASRRVKVGTVYLRPRESTPARNLDLWCQQVDAAGKAGLDIVCLSEAILQVGTQASAGEVAESIPGPSSDRLSAAARRNRLWVVAGLMERDGDQLFNTAVLLNRAGQLAGKYRKVHLPREEWQKGIAPGHDYPVFQTDFGTVAIQICYDFFFPETAQIFAQEGAEIIFAPTWGDTMPDSDGTARGETVFRVRARDNGVFLVPSVYDGNSLILDPLGRILASSKGKTGVFWSEIDLNQREPLWYVGYWRSIGPRHRMPETYAPLLQRPSRPNY
jgi:predicted amidohydrolase